MPVSQTTLDGLRADGSGDYDAGDGPRRAALVGCGDSKNDGPLPAREKYRSTYFGLKRDFAEDLCERWWILSAKFGLLDPDRVIDDYNVSITDNDVDEADWVDRVVDALAAVEWGSGEWELYALAGSDYLEATAQDGRPLRVHLSDATPETVTVRFPFDDLAGIGYQNGWLADCRDQHSVVPTADRAD